MCCMVLSCLLSSINPLGKREEAIFDTNLPGVWYIVSEEDPLEAAYLVVLKKAEDYYKFIFIYNAEDAPLELEGYITSIGWDRYLNLHLVGYDCDENERAVSSLHTFMYYRITDKNELILAWFDEEFFEKAIDEGLIEGEYDEIFVELNDTSERVRELLLRYEKEDYLEELVVYKKMKM